MTDAPPTSASPVSRNLLAEVLGWYGTVAIVGAYLLVSFEVLESDSAVYQLLNLTGALGIIVISWVKGVKQGVVLNLVWTAIAIAALVRIVT